MGWQKLLLKGKKWGKGLRSSGTSAIKTVPPGVGGLKKSREMFESLQSAADTGVKKFGRHHTTELLSKQGVEKGVPGMTKKAGDITRLQKKVEKITGKKIKDLELKIKK